MKFLVSGAKGQLASDIAGALRGRSAEFFAPDEKELDITNQAMVTAAVEGCRPDVIINCAAYNAVDEAEDQWRKAFMINGVGVRNLALAAVKTGAVLVHFSTDYVFDGAKDRPYTIADNPGPLSRYGESKLLGEMYARDLTDKFFLVRLSWVFGAGAFSFPLKLLQWAAGRKELKIVDDQIACPAYTGHLAAALLDLIDTGAFGLYHMTNTGFCSKYEWAKFILDSAGWRGELLPAKTADFNSPAERPAFSALDCFPLQETIGYSLPTWQEATEEFMRKRA